MIYGNNTGITFIVCHDDEDHPLIIKTTEILKVCNQPKRTDFTDKGRSNMILDQDLVHRACIFLRENKLVVVKETVEQVLRLLMETSLCAMLRQEQDGDTVIGYVEDGLEAKND